MSHLNNKIHILILIAAGLIVIIVIAAINGQGHSSNGSSDLYGDSAITKSIDPDIEETSSENASEEVSSATITVSNDTEPQSQRTYLTESDEILPFSSDRIITESDIDSLHAWQLQMAINEIYARHGFVFEEPFIRTFFHQYDWYEPTTGASDFDPAVLSQTEQNNISFLRQQIRLISSANPQEIREDEARYISYKNMVKWSYPAAVLEHDDIDRYSGVIFSGTYDINRDGEEELILGLNTLGSSADKDDVEAMVYGYDAEDNAVRLINTMHHCIYRDEPGCHGFQIISDNEGHYYIGVISDDPDSGSDNYANQSIYYLNFNKNWVRRHSFFGSSLKNDPRSQEFRLDGKDVTKEALDSAMSNYTLLESCDYRKVNLTFQ